MLLTLVTASLLEATLGHVISKADGPANAPTARSHLALHPGAILVRRPGRQRSSALSTETHMGFEILRGPEPLHSRGINVLGDLLVVAVRGRDREPMGSRDLPHGLTLLYGVPYPKP